MEDPQAVEGELRMGGRQQGVVVDGQGPPQEVEEDQAAIRESSWQRARRRRQREEDAILVEARDPFTLFAHASSNPSKRYVYSWLPHILAKYESYVFFISSSE